MYSDEEKKVFGPYHNGVREVYADPLAVYRRLVFALGGDPNAALRDHRSPDPEVRFHATSRLVEAARFAFGMAPFDESTGGGALEDQCLAVVDDYLAWVEKKNPRGVTSPTCSPPTDPPSSGAGPSTTASGVPSGSI